MSNAYHYDREAQWYAKQKPNKPSNNTGQGSNTNISQGSNSANNSGLWFTEDNNRVGVSSPAGTPSYGSSGGSSGGYSPPPKPKPINPYTGTSDGYGTEWTTGEDYYQQKLKEVESKGHDFIGVGTAKQSDYINLNANRDAYNTGYAQYLNNQKYDKKDYGENGSAVRPDAYVNPTLRPQDMLTQRVDWEKQDEMELIQKALDEVLKGNTIATDNAVRQLEGNRDKITQNYDQQAQDSYVQYMLGNKNLGEQMAVSGINGGMAESTRLESQANYQNVASKIGQERSNSLNSLDNEIAIMRANGDLQGAQIASQYALKMAEAAERGNQRLFDELNALRQYELQNRQLEYGMQQDAYNRDFQREQWNYGVGQDALDRDWQREQWDYNLSQNDWERQMAQARWELESKGMGLDNRKAELQLANMLAKQGAARSTGRTSSGSYSGSGGSATRNASFTPQTTASPVSSSNYQTPTQADLKGISNILAERIKRGDLLY